LRDGGYGDDDNVDYPAIVEGSEYRGWDGVTIGFNVSQSELTRVGFNHSDELVPLYWSLLSNECEIVECAE
jgi:hypothetical protein